MYCWKCGNYSNFSINGLCQNCLNLQTYYTASHQYDYKCPNCNGEFVYPSHIRKTNFTNFIYVCPFCNKEMKGIK